MRATTLFLSFYLLAFPFSASAQSSGGVYEEDLAGERQKLAEYIKSFRNFLRERGDESIKAIDSQVHFEVSPAQAPNAWVENDPRKSRITISMTAEYRLLITYLADADVVSVTTPGFFQCRLNYVTRLFDTLANNRQRSFSGQTPLRLPAPEIFLMTAPAECRKFKDSFPIDPKHRAGRDFAVNTVVALGYLHELGHIALGHQSVSLSSIERLPDGPQRLNEFLRLMTRSRAQEEQADDWAIDRFVDLSPNPREALTNVLLSFYMVFGGFDCSLEAADTHPNGFQRFARQISRMRDRAIAAGKLNNSALAIELMNEIQTFAVKAQEKLKCPKRS